MHILITGGTGFIGRQLCRALRSEGHQLSIFSRRSPSQVKALCGEDVAVLNELTAGSLRQPVDGVINLAGEPIADRRWSQKRQQLLRDSRIRLTNDLIGLCGDLTPRPAWLISASAVGVYGDQGNAKVDETTIGHQDFAQQLCSDWEQAALQAETLGMRVCLVRTGLVVGRNGGFLGRLLLPFKLGLGGRLGSGQQWMPWIHMHDLVAIYRYLAHHDHCQGVYNATAPNPVTNAEFTRILGQQLHRLTPFPVPAWLLRLALGDMSLLLLGGQQAVPARLINETQFQFRFATLQEALTDVLKPIP